VRVFTFIFLLIFTHKIYAQRGWEKLLHYDPELRKSRISNPNFYLSKNGQLNPNEELEASILKMKAESNDTLEKERFSCRFPARRNYIKTHFPTIDSPNCPWLEEKLNHARPYQVVFIFASQFLGNPSSTMGHTFMRFDYDPSSTLIGNSFSYAASNEIKHDSTLQYIWKGLFGGYQGEYSLTPFYPRAHEYGNIENRDLWEYEIKLSEDQRVFLLEHAFELSNAGNEPYLFLNRNCAAVILDFLDVVFPEYELGKNAVQFFYSPLQGLKLLNEKKLLGNVFLRKSLRTESNETYNNLSSIEKDLVQKLINGNLSISTINEPKILDVAMSILTYRKLTNELNEQQDALIYSIGVARSKLELDHSSSINPKIMNNLSGDPLNGHDTHQLSLGVIKSNEQKSLQLGFRAAGHAIEDRSSGHLDNTQILFFDGSIRIQSTYSTKKLILNQLSFIDIKSFSPYSIIDHSFSWSGSFSIISTLGSAYRNGYALRSEISSGLSDRLGPVTGYFLLNGTVDTWKPRKNISFHMGPGLTTGLLYPITNHFFAKASVKIDYLKLSNSFPETIKTFECLGSFQFEKNSSLILTMADYSNLTNHQFDRYEYLLKLTHHF
jgi:hypothetical protein